MKNISVIIPSLNPDTKLSGVVKSLQNVGLCDIILVDDGSKIENKKYFLDHRHFLLFLNIVDVKPAL